MSLLMPTDDMELGLFVIETGKIPEIDPTAYVNFVLTDCEDEFIHAIKATAGNTKILMRIVNSGLIKPTYYYMGSWPWKINRIGHNYPYYILTPTHYKQMRKKKVEECPNMIYFEPLKIL